ncbi:MAG: hypothetical protein JO027_03705 [Solirubrobacterales bacterium]|nr:hypothetical protein [Solirubrobacterales bacterium]
MTGKLIMLPLRVWFRSARLLTHAATGVAGRAVSLAGQTIGVTSPNGSDHDRRAASANADPGWREETIEQPVSPVDVEHPHDEPERRPTPAQPRHTARTRSVSAVRPLREEREAPVVREPEAPAAREPEAPVVREPEAPAAREPVHVSEEPELVREVAEPGAEDGAGASVTVIQPWNGYGQMNAREVIARARQASPAELAAVRLYESRHRSRQTVLAAVDRQLKLSGGGNPA